MNVRKEAKKDAFEFARAQMLHGQGAGTRRKLIRATVDHKADTLPGYLAAFNTALLEQDMASHAVHAKRARKVVDTSQALSRNVKGVATGNYRSVNTSILVLLGTGYVLHQSGWDKVIFTKAKQKYDDLRKKNFRLRIVRDEKK